MSTLTKAWETKAKELLYTEEWLLKRIALLQEKVLAAKEITWVWRTFRKQSDIKCAGEQSPMLETSDQEMEALEFFDYTMRKTGEFRLPQLY